MYEDTFPPGEGVSMKISNTLITFLSLSYMYLKYSNMLNFNFHHSIILILDSVLSKGFFVDQTRGTSIMHCVPVDQY